jgi:group II intron reverse transcriptase/maturase
MSMHADEESDEGIVPVKRSNKERLRSAETVEGRASPEENGGQATAVRTPSRVTASNRLAAVRQAARQSRDVRFTALLHHITIDLLKQSYIALQRDAAPGIDGVTWRTYGENLEAKLKDLHERIHKGSYRARPARRTYIPKADGGRRPLGILVLDDKIVQGAVAEVLSAIYEVDFLGFSYGFRPGRNPHQALESLKKALMTERVNWVLDADIRSFYDSVDHEWMLRMLAHRIADPRILRLIRQWLRAGVLESGEWRETDEGTPQGAGISPILSNIFLHYALDLWAHAWRRGVARGRVIVVRYADDFVMGFERESDARNMVAALKERMAKFRLALHEDKTRLIMFGRFAVERRAERGLGRPETFDFLGFTHYCGKTRSGHFKVKRRTSKKKFRAGLRGMKDWLKQERNREKTGELLKKARQKLEGHLNYYAVTDNWQMCDRFRYQAERIVLKWLNRRSQRRSYTWKRYKDALAWVGWPSIRIKWNLEPCRRELALNGN